MEPQIIGTKQLVLYRKMHLSSEVKSTRKLIWELSVSFVGLYLECPLPEVLLSVIHILKNSCDDL